MADLAKIAGQVAQAKTILSTVAGLVSIYKQIRNDVQAAVPATDPATGGAFLTDEQLADLLKQDAVALQQHVEGLLAKHGVPAKPARTNNDDEDDQA